MGLELELTTVFLIEELIVVEDPRVALLEVEVTEGLTVVEEVIAFKDEVLRVELVSLVVVVEAFTSVEGLELGLTEG